MPKSQSPFQNVTIIGGGAWGTALAATVQSAGRTVTIWARETEVVAGITSDHRNSIFLPGVDLDPSIKATTDIAEACAQAEAILVVVPSQFLRPVLTDLAKHIGPSTAICLCCKGIEQDSGLMMSQVAEAVLPDRPIAVLSGPSFAIEVARGEPTLVTIASTDMPKESPASSIAAKLAQSIGTPSFRPYVSDDVIGVEIGGAVKNVLAIACGIATGLGFGSNTRAALITRGLNEIKALAEALGGRRETVSGLSGIGDLTLTCSSEQSRNMSFGLALGKGLTITEALGGRPQVVEGMVNAVAVTDLAKKLGVTMPISEAVRSIVADHVPIKDAMIDLMSRPFRGEPETLELELHQGSSGDVAKHLSRGPSGA